MISKGKIKKKNFWIFTGIVVLSGIIFYSIFRTPKVSIVMPVYNGAEYLNKTINFLLASEFQNFEFIIIDDGSSDDSATIIQELAQEDNRIKFYQNSQNMGIAKTRNRGFELARGKYIAPMDQDDLSLPKRLKLEVEYLDKHPDVAIVDVGTITLAAYYKGIKEERMGGVAWLMNTYQNERNHYSLDERDENIKLSLFFSCAVPTQSAAMMRRAWLDEYHIRYREGIKYADDYYLYADMIKKGARFHHIEDIEHIYNDVREHSDTFVQKQIDEVTKLKQDLFTWAGLDYSRYIKLEVKDYMCQLFDDILKQAENKQRFSKQLLTKNQKLLCATNK